MLSAIQTSSNTQVIAAYTDKSAKPFECPECSSEVILKKGILKTAHFAHKPPVYCQYGKGESELHRMCKMSLYESFKNHPSVTKCELERSLGSIRPDVSMYINGKPVAVEVQISTLTMTEIIRRTTEYFRKKIFVLWLPIFSENITLAPYSPKAWERWLHSLNFGHIYYWKENTKVIPASFSEYYINVPVSTWYTEGGEEHSHGGYDRVSRRYKTVTFGKPIDLISDFKTLERREWTGKTFSIPESRIYTSQ